MKYTIDYFIKKLSKIPANRWCANTYTKKLKGRVLHCALGHCGATDSWGTTVESMALNNLSRCRITSVNDGENGWRSHGKSPKTRVIAFLKELKKQGVK